MIALSDPRLTPILALTSSPFERVESTKSGCIGYQAGMRVQISPSNSHITRRERTLMRLYLPTQEVLGDTKSLLPQYMQTLLSAALGARALHNTASLYQYLQGSLLRQDPSQTRAQLFRVGTSFQRFGIGSEIFRSEHLAQHFGCFITDVGDTTLRADWQYVEVCLPHTQHERLEILHTTQTPWMPT